MQAAPSRYDSGYSWWLAALTLLMASLGFGAVTAVPVMLLPIAADFGCGAAPVAAVHSAVLAGAGVSSLWIGRVQDRIGFFPLAVAASLATCAGLVMASRATTLGQLALALGVLVGACGQGVLFSPLTAAISQWFDRHRATAIALATSGQGLGGLLIPPLLRWSERQHGWRTTLLGFGLIAGLLLLAASLAYRRTPPCDQPRGSVAASAVATPAGRPMLRLGLSLALFNGATFSVVGHLTAAAEESGAGPLRAANLVAVLLGASLVSRLAVPLLSARVGTTTALRVGCAVHFAGACLLAMTLGNYGAMLAAVLLVGAGFGSYLPCYALIVRETYPAAQAGRRISEVYVFGFAAAALGTWIGGVLRDWSGAYDWTFQANVIAAAMGWFVLAGKASVRASPKLQ